MSRSRRALFLLTTDLVVPKKCTPGATAEHEGLHERSFGLDGVVQIVSCPCVQHLCQRDDTQRGMLFRPSQVFIRHLFEQVILTRFCGGVECGGYLIDCSYMTGLMYCKVECLRVR